MRKRSALFIRHILVLSVTLLCFLTRSGAQTDFPIGTGTTGNTGTTYPTPLQDWYEGARMQFLYTAAELTAAGMGPGNISGIKFEVTNLNTFSGSIQDMSIKIGGTATTSLSTAATVWETTSLAFGPVDYVPTLGTNTFTFTTPFFWNGTDNIVIEVCNGLPGNTSDGIIHYTNNVTVPWTSGLSFNGSHSLVADDAGNLCSATTGLTTGTATARPNITFSWIAASACSGMPTGGTASANPATLCNPTTPFTVTVTGATAATGITYQWESSTDNITWTPIAGATGPTLNVPSLSTNTWYRRKITCTTNSAYSTATQVTVIAATYAALPFTESFETSWVDVCGDNDVPNNNWRNTPPSGNNSWRRDDDGATGSWTNITNGMYPIAASDGARSARFHTWPTSSGQKGRLDLYINASTGPGNKELLFDFINTTGNDSLVVSISTNGGASFFRMDSVRVASVWRTKAIYFASTSATTVIRFEATSDFGTTDIGLDNIRINYFPDCSGTPVGGTVNAFPLVVCNATTPINLTVTGSTNAALLTYQWQSSADGITWTNIAGATGQSYQAPGIAVNTWFRRVTTCAGTPGNSSAIQITTPPPAYTTLPYAESFENTWIDKCDVRDVPNNFWRNNPVTGNNSWRRNDDGVAANWVNPTFGMYNPAASAGTYSARFHTYQASSGSIGQLDLFVNASGGAANKSLSFDFINTTGNDSMVVFISNNGPAGPFIRLDSVRTSSVWRTKTIIFGATSATTVIRFQVRSDFGVTDVGLDNISLVDFPDCSGTPVGGTTVASTTAPCSSTSPFTLSVNGSTNAGNITYQWQQSTDGGTTWTNIAGATGATYTSTGISVPTDFRRTILCGANSSNSSVVSVSIGSVVYVNLPYAESFENVWINGCGTRDIPNIYWKNTPVTGNNSWRRDDDAETVNSAAWVNPTFGAYTPRASNGTRSARFHSYQASSGTTGTFDLHINASSSPAPVKRLSFDFINTSGNDSLVILISTTGPSGTFVRLDSARTATAWRTKTINFNSTSATTVIRFRATSDFGVTDIGLDNINVIDWADCTGTPNGGTAVSSVTNACVDPFTLSFTGATSGNGVTYQWQSAPTATGAWTDIPGATGFTHTTAQVGTTFYRVLVSCSFSSQSAGSSAVQVISPTPVNGTFTINSSLPTTIPTNFNNFNAAYDYIRCGINGPVVFNVQTGVGYNEQLIMSAVPGASAVNTVTFKGNGVAAIGFGATSGTERAVIKLRGTKHIIFDSLIVNANTGTFGYGFQLMPNSDSNIIRNNTINVSQAVTTQNYAGIVINGTDAGPISVGNTLADYNQILNNNINGGFAGVTLVATFAGGANGNNTIKGNRISNFYQYGIYVAGSYFTLIDSNIISRPTRATVGDFNGVYFGAQKNINSTVSRNRIKDPFGGNLASTNAFYGINFDNSDGSVSSQNTVVNNLIYKVNGNGTSYGIQNIGSDEVYYLHNTVTMDSATATSTAATRAFSQTTAANGIVFVNNLLSVTRGGAGTKHVIYLGSTPPVFADNNVYYINAAGGTSSLGFFSGNKLTIADWRTAMAPFGIEQNSVSANPAFSTLNENYIPGNAGINDLGQPVGVTEDILSVVRNATTPDVGAFEFTPPLCSIPPVNGTTTLSATVICQNSPVYMTLNIGAYGSSQTFQWQTAPSATGPWTNLGTPMLTPDTTIISGVTTYYRAIVGCSGSIDSSNAVLLTVNAALPAGTYTINKTQPTTYNPLAPVVGTNFNSFNAAKNAMGCGILGGVVFNVVPGTGPDTNPYNEQLILDSIKGASALNRVVFNGNANHIAFSSANNTERAVIKLNGADYITFDSLVINATGGTYGYGVQLIRFADSNIFRNNIIITDTVSLTQNFAGVVINATDAGVVATGSTGSDYNLFDRNRIIGGYYGITNVGATTAAGYVRNNEFTNNSIEDFYFAGIQVTGTFNTLIEGNRFHRPGRLVSSTSVYGVYATGTLSNNLQVSKNRFYNPYAAVPTQTASSFYGVYHNSVDAGAGNEGVVSNNLFYWLNSNGPLYALYNAGSNNVRYYHNTIAIDHAASTATGQTAGFYQTTSATGIEFVNNIVTIRRGGIGNKHAIYLATSTSEVTSNYNDFYIIPAGTNNYVGYFNGNRTTLQAWQTASLKDANSISMDPVYIDPANGNFMPGLQPIDNKGTPVNILTDINNVTRSTTTPDIGAYEFAPPACTLPPVAGTASITPNSGICLEVPVSLTLTGHSAIGTLTFQWQHSFDGVNWVNLGPLQYSPNYDTVSSTRTYYRAVVTCGTTSVTSNTIQLNLNTIMPGGTYTINSTLPANYTGVPGQNFQNWQSAVAAMSCGITGPVVFNVSGAYNEQVRIPYVPGTSATNTVTFQSATGTPSGGSLSFASTIGTANYTLQLDSASNFRFRNLTLEATGTSFGRVVDIIKGSYNDQFHNNTINGPVTTTNTNAFASVYTNTERVRDIMVKGNTFNNGASAIYFSGNGPAYATSGNIVDSNFVNNAYGNGIDVRLVKDFIITRNTVNMAASGASGAVVAGIHTSAADSALRVIGNKVNFNNVTTAAAYGILVTGTRAAMIDSAIVASNTILAGTGNTGSIYGLGIASSAGVSVVNNVIGINSAGPITYGLYSNNNTAGGVINFYNNTINLQTASASGYAGYFTQTATSLLTVKNNIFSNVGGGRALYVNNPSLFTADYNMLYTTGPTLVQVAIGSTLNFPTLKTWTNTWNWDRNSIVYAPAFISTTDLRPNLSNPDVWAMHGRGVQIRGNSYDFNNNYRPQTLTEGVPDLGAYEFFPTSLPTILTATPGAPAPNTTQVFTYGTDTVQRITWGATVPATVTVRRYSGVVPSGLTPGIDSMFFYTDVDVSGTNTYQYHTKLYYIEPWMGSIPNENRIGLGRTLASNAWVVGATSRVDVGKNEISQESLAYLDRFTGLLNPFSLPENEDSSSNRGKDFWVAYQRSYDFTVGNGQEMVLYFGAGAQAANVTVTIDNVGTGTPYVHPPIFVPANTAVSSNLLPKGVSGADARMILEGLHAGKGIHITSDVPIVAYAHIYAGANSGATMLMPTAVWGYEYYTLQTRQNYTSTNSHSAFYVVAQADSTWVEINPANPTTNGWTRNGGTRPNGSYLVKLNKGDAYQVLGAYISGSEGYDLTGSYIKSVSNNQNQCHPIAAFAGSTRTYTYCSGSTGGGDLIMQQIFPYQAWGNKYLTAPFHVGTTLSAATIQQTIYRVAVKDPATVVTRNGNTLTGYNVAGKYYEFISNTADVIEANKPILVAQIMGSSGSCTPSASVGDPELIYISPMAQAVKQTQFYRNDQDNITVNFVTLTIPAEGLNTLRIDGINYSAYPVTDVYVYDHPNMPGYKVVSKRWGTGTGSSTAESDYPFTGIVYGEGSVESYGYNMGTLVRNLNNLSSVTTALNTGTSATEYTCKNAPFKISALLPMQPTSIFWKLSAQPRLSPNADTTWNNPVAAGTVTVNGIMYYKYTLPNVYTMDSAGIFEIPITFSSPEIERCDQKMDGKVFVQVLPAPLTNFTTAFTGGGAGACEGETATFTGDIVTANGIALNQWNWTFSNAPAATGQVQTVTYPTPGNFTVTLRGITADGCVSDTTKTIVINAKPVVTVTTDSLSTCPGDPVTFTVAAPAAGATYRYYTTPTGGTALTSGASYTINANGTSFTVLNPAPPMEFYVEGTSAAGCTSASRKRIVVGLSQTLLPTTVTVGNRGATSVIFNWTAVTGANQYEVSLDGGVTWITPSSGATGLTHTVNGLGTLQSVTILVRAKGATACAISTSAATSGCSDSPAAVPTNIATVCGGTAATFNVSPVTPGITYTWFTTATGGTALATGGIYNITNNGATFAVTPTAAGNFYVQQQSASGCVSSTRTMVTVNFLPNLASPVVTADSVGVNAIRFTWAPITGATGYQVSLDNGTTWIAANGANSHTVSGLQPMQEQSILVRALGGCTIVTSTVATQRTLGDQIFIPNTFTPNGDGSNDVLRVYAQVIKEMRFMVFNQWGEKIYESRDLNMQWDGRSNGKAQPSGVYMYVVDITLKDGTKTMRKGSVNLIR